MRASVLAPSTAASGRTLISKSSSAISELTTAMSGSTTAMPGSSTAMPGSTTAPRRRLKQTTISPWRRIPLSFEEHELVYKYHSRFADLGLTITDESLSQQTQSQTLQQLQPQQQHLQQSGSPPRDRNMRLIVVQTVPCCFVEREISELKQHRKSVIDDLIISLVKSQLHFWISTKGLNSTTLPGTIRNVLNSRACHGAIKFGDALEKRRCAQLVAELSACKNPFACAHGRPTIFPLVHLEEVEEELGRKCREELKRSGEVKQSLCQTLKKRMATMEL